jgi:hypothetical protein
MEEDEVDGECFEEEEEGQGEEEEEIKGEERGVRFSLLRKLLLPGYSFWARISD